MPTSSSRVNTPSAWCPVAWEKTLQCISSWARPWCTPRRLSPSRDASLSSTTPTVCSLFHTYPPSDLSISFLGQNTLLASHSSPLSPLVQPAASIFLPGFISSCLFLSLCPVMPPLPLLVLLLYHGFSSDFVLSPLFRTITLIFIHALLFFSPPCLPSPSFSRCIACFLSNPPLPPQLSYSAFFIPNALRAPTRPPTHKPFPTSFSTSL